MLKRFGVIVLSTMILAGCSSVDTAKDKQGHAIWAYLKPYSVSQEVIQKNLAAPACNYSTYNLTEGQYMPRYCLDAFALNVAHLTYQEQFDPAVNAFLNEDAQQSLMSLRAANAFQDAASGQVFVIGNPIVVSQGQTALSQTYQWVVRVPILIAVFQPNKPVGEIDKVLVLIINRTHDQNTNGLVVSDVQVRDIGYQKMHTYLSRAVSPYLPTSAMTGNPYSHPIVIDNPVPAQVTIYKGDKQLVTKWVQAGPQDISTDNFPAGNYPVTIKMASPDGQFVREYTETVDRTTVVANS